VRETWEQFKTGVIKTLYNISVDYLNNIITSMPTRMHAVLQADGFRINTEKVTMTTDYISYISVSTNPTLVRVIISIFSHMYMIVFGN
jgi:hypothetical protein